MVDFYEDSRMNEIANSIDVKIMNLYNGINPLNDNKTAAEKVIMEKYLKSIVNLADEFMNSVMVDLIYLQDYAPTGDKNHLKFNDTISNIVVSQLIRMSLQLTNMSMANKSAFKADKLLVEKTKNELNRTKNTMQRFILIHLSDKSIPSLEENIRLFNLVDATFKKITKKRWFFF